MCAVFSSRAVHMHASGGQRPREWPFRSTKLFTWIYVRHYTNIRHSWVRKCGEFKLYLYSSDGGKKTHTRTLKYIAKTTPHPFGPAANMPQNMCQNPQRVATSSPCPCERRHESFPALVEERRMEVVGGQPLPTGRQRDHAEHAALTYLGAPDEREGQEDTHVSKGHRPGWR